MSKPRNEITSILEKDINERPEWIISELKKELSLQQ
jgi:hypothetical protein